MAYHIPHLKCSVPKSREEEEEDERTYQRYREIVLSLPTERGMSAPLYHYQGFWYSPDIGAGLLAARDYFKGRPTDIILATTPKSGTTWLKSLIFAVMNRKLHPPMAQHPLLEFNSHALMPFLEATLYNPNANNNRIPDLDLLHSPRLLATHIPYASLPQSVIDSRCRIVYLCRNIKDTFVSHYHFINKLRSKSSSVPLTIEETFEKFCRGLSRYGPIWDHVLGYWNASLQKPPSVLFVKYEEMHANPVFHLRRMAEFIGFPFSAEEEREGVVDEILKLCSFESLSSLEVNNNGVTPTGINHNALFRKGKVGDWASHLTSEMVERIDCITNQKFHGNGLTL